MTGRMIARAVGEEIALAQRGSTPPKVETLTPPLAKNGYHQCLLSLIR